MNRLLLGVLLISLAGVVSAAGDAKAGKAKAVACGACHGQDAFIPCASGASTDKRNQAVHLCRATRKQEGIGSH